jgi:hypothetical protein
MDTLTKIKNRLNFDQRNLSSGVVISTNNSTAKVRLNDGTIKTAYLGSNTVNQGQLVQIAIDGNLASVQGAATLQARAAEKTVILS